MYGFMKSYLHYSECDGDITLDDNVTFDDNVTENPEDETLDALDENFENQVEDVTLDAPKSADNWNAAANDVKESQMSSSVFYSVRITPPHSLMQADLLMAVEGCDTHFPLKY